MREKNCCYSCLHSSYWSQTVAAAACENRGETVLYVLLLINMTPVPALFTFAFRGFVSGADFLIIIQTQLECYCYHPEWLIQNPSNRPFWSVFRQDTIQDTEQHLTKNVLGHVTRTATIIEQLLQLHLSMWGKKISSYSDNWWITFLNRNVKHLQAPAF